MPSHYTPSSNPVPATPGIYQIRCTVTNRIYVGSAVNLYRRWIQHRHDLQRNKRKNPKLQSAWNKYGRDAFVFEVLEYVLLPELLTAREQYWFDTLKPFDRRGFNLSQIAESRLGMKATPEQIEKNRLSHLGQTPWNLGKKHTPEAIENMRLSHLGQVPHNRGKKASLEAREKMRQSHLGIPTHNLGYKHTPEALAKMSASQQGRVHSPATRAKMSATRLGKPGKKLSPQRIEQMRQANRGKPGPMLGKKHSPASREKMRRSHLGKPLSEDHKRNAAEAHRGIKQKPEAIEKTRLANLGRVRSPETRARSTDAHTFQMKTLVVTSPDGTEYTVIGINRFCREHNLYSSSLIQVAQGKRSHSQGWKARYLEKDRCQFRSTDG